MDIIETDSEEECDDRTLPAGFLIPDFTEMPIDCCNVFTMGTLKDWWISVSKSMHSSMHPLASDRLDFLTF